MTLDVEVVPPSTSRSRRRDPSGLRRSQEPQPRSRSTRATATLEGGQFATENFRRALLSAQSGGADAVFFTPFNKKAMRLAYDGYDDEIRFVRDVLNTSAAASEFNVLGKPLECARDLAYSAVAGIRRHLRGCDPESR